MMMTVYSTLRIYETFLQKNKKYFFTIKNKIIKILSVFVSQSNVYNIYIIIIIIP